MRKFAACLLVTLFLFLSSCAKEVIDDTYQKNPVEKEFEQRILLLVREMKDLNAIDTEEALLLIQAADNGYYDSMTYLLKKGANPNIKESSTKASALHQAVSKPGTPRPNPVEEKMIRLLIDNKATVDATDSNGDTPLHKAVNGGRLEAAQLLIDRKANPNISNVAGLTALHVAVMNGDVPMVELLVRSGAGVNAVTGGNITVVDLAQSEVTKRTTKWGGRKEADGNTSLEAYVKILDLLKKAGGKTRLEMVDGSRAKPKSKIVIRGKTEPDEGGTAVPVESPSPEASPEASPAETSPSPSVSETSSPPIIH